MQKKNFYFIAGAILVIVAMGGVYFMLNVKKPSTTSQILVTQKIPSSKDTIKLVTNKSLYIFTDEKGMTLYHDIQDWPKSSKPPYNPYTKCTGECNATWLPFYTDSVKISPPLKAEDFTIFTRQDGKKQVAYRGWPLYYYVGDSKPGDVNGQNIGNVWYAGISPD